MAVSLQHGVSTILANAIGGSAFKTMLFPTRQRSMTEITDNYFFYKWVAKGSMAGNKQEQSGQQYLSRSGMQGYEDAP